MKIFQVERPLVSTNRIASMKHKNLQVVKDGSSRMVAVDSIGVAPGDWVLCVGSSAARDAAGAKEYPSDLTIVGIIDKWPLEEDIAAAEAKVKAAAEAKVTAEAEEKAKLVAAITEVMQSMNVKQDS